MRSLRDGTSLPGLVIIEGEVVDQAADASGMPEQPSCSRHPRNLKTIAAMRGRHVCPAPNIADGGSGRKRAKDQM
jgi:hypothetical protein